MTSEGEIKEQFPSYLFDTEQASLVFLTRISMHVYYTAVPKLDAWSVWIGRDCTLYFTLGL